MSNRNVIIRQREALTGVVAELDAVRRCARSRDAEAHIGRAQSLLQLTISHLHHALKTEFDTVIDVKPVAAGAGAPR